MADQIDPASHGGARWRGRSRSLGGMGLVVAVVIAIAVALGIWFRFDHLADQVYNVDEVRGLARALGYDANAVMGGLFGEPMATAGEIFRFQQPEAAQSWGATLAALAGNPEHPPLYYLMTRVAMELAGAPVGMRYCSVLLGLLVFPAVFWLCRELFFGAAGRDRVGWLAVAVLAISPYAIEMARLGRQYSLWQLLICLSTASLLLTVRSPRWRHAALYGVCMALGFYTHWFFCLTAMVHTAYGVMLWLRDRAYRLPVVRLAIAGSGAVVLFIPWVLVLLGQRQQTQKLTAWVAGQAPSLVERCKAWGNNLEELVLDFNAVPSLKGATLAGMLVLMGLAIYGLWRWGSRPARWLLLGPLVVTIAGQVIPDLLLGGARSTTGRYLVTANLSLSLILAVYLDDLLRSPTPALARRTGAIALVGLVAVGGLSGAIVRLSPRAAVGEIQLNAAVAEVIRRERPQGERPNAPWIIGDAGSRYMFHLSLSHLLPATVEFHWLRQEDPPAQLATLRQALAQQRPVWFYRPKDSAVEAIAQQPDLHLEPVIRDERAGNYPWLYRLQWRRLPGTTPTIAP